MANVTCIYTDKNGINHAIKTDNMKSKISCRILEESKISLRNRKVRATSKVELEYDER